jgi:hypothetical protein
MEPISQEHRERQMTHLVENEQKSNDFNAWRFSVAPMMD